MCIIDVHNYAHWWNDIIGQGGVLDADCVSLWTQLATKYKINPQVAFGLMIEPVSSGLYALSSLY